MREIAIIIPAYNEEARIGSTLREYVAFFDKKHNKEYKIIVSANGCKDNTVKVVKSFIKEEGEKVGLVVDENKIGKGGALIKAMKEVESELVCYVDADLSVSPQELNRLIEVISKQSKVDCVVGSREKSDSKVIGKKKSRKIMSLGFNKLVNSLFDLKIKDTQCGAKVVRLNMLKRALPSLTIHNMAFDVNFLVAIKKANGNIKEVGITWVDDLATTINKPVKTSIVMALSVVNLRLKSMRLKWLYFILSPFIKTFFYLILSKEEYKYQKY